jgi:hypothetical protein
MNTVAREVAEQEINSWLDYKKVSERKREANKDSIETLVDAVADGSLLLREDKTLVHELKFPTDGDKPLTKLEYVPRLKMSTIHNKLQGVKASDPDGRICAYVGALTSQTIALVRSLETEDYSISQAIAIFFL